MTYGGYSAAITVDQHFVLRIPENLDPAAAAPLLCAGITTWSPLRHWGVGPGTRVGVVGLGGLGHMGVKLASALGAEVTVFTTSAAKSADARRLGASRVVVSTESSAMQSQANRLDLVLDTVAVPHELDPYLRTLLRDGTLVLLGIPATRPPPPRGPPPGARPASTGRLGDRWPHGDTGNARLLRDPWDRLGIEQIPIQQINEAYERMIRGDVQYRFVIDMGSLGSVQRGR